MIRGTSDNDIMEMEKIGKRQLRAWKKRIREAGLESLPETSEEQRNLFNIQVMRWVDVIRQANEKLKMVEGTVNAAGLLKVISEATKYIVDYSQKVGIIPKVADKIKQELVGGLELEIPNLEGLAGRAVSASIENFLERESKKLREASRQPL